MAEVLHLAPRRAGVSRQLALGSSSPINQTHVEWAGCSLHDLIQPSFSFLVGVALPFSLARPRGQRRSRTASCSLHALWRSLLLVALGIFLRSIGRADQLHLRGHAHADRPGLSVPVPARRCGRRACSGPRSASILVGYWAGVRALSAAGAGLRLRRPSACRRTGRITTPASPRTGTRTPTSAWAFDTWFLNLFPREKPFVANGGGYAHAQLHPDAGHDDPRPDRRRLAASDAAPRMPFERLAARRRRSVLAAGGAAARHRHLPGREAHLDAGWTLFSGGWCFLLLAGFYWVIDARGYRTLGLPAGRHRDELDRRLPHRAPVRGLHRVVVQASTSAPACFDVLGDGLAAARAGRWRPARLLADPVLDVSPEAVSADLRAPLPNPLPAGGERSFLRLSPGARLPGPVGRLTVSNTPHLPLPARGPAFAFGFGAPDEPWRSRGEGRGEG